MLRKRTFLAALGAALAVSPAARAQVTTPPGNQAFQFNGSTGVVKVPNFGAPAGSFSIEAWARIDAGGAAEDDIVSTHENPGPRRGYFIEYAYPGGNTPGLRAGIAGSSGAFVNAQYSNANWQPGQWHHVVMVYNATAKSIKLYQDGTLVASTTLAATETPVFSTRPFAIGGSDNYAGNAFKGAIDEVRFWNRELRAGEIDTTAHLLGNRAGLGLKAYYPLDSLLTNQAVRNVAGTGFTGTAAATMTAADVIPSYAPIQAAPRTGLVYRANWAGKNNAPTGGLTVVSTYATEPTYVLHGRSTGTGLTATGVPATVARRLQQAWHFTKIGTGASQPNTLRFSLTDLNIIPGTTGPLYLLRSAANANFARIGTVADSGVVAGNVVSFAIADTTSAYLTLGFGRAPQLDGPLVAVNSAWKYLADGSNQGAAWQAAAFNDTAWPSGNAELGYGDGDEATVVPYGPSSSAKYTTTYFRQQFTVNSLANFNAVKLRLKRDDGAVVYINGVEVYRSNMPTGAITSSTFAASTVDGAAEVAYFETMLPKTVVTAGLNTIAVEIHQANLTSSDISFNLELLKDQSIILVCNPLPATHLTNFTSVVPGTQQQQLSIPATHTFQKLMQSGDAYSNPADGTVLESNDFTGYVPINGSSTNGYLAVNHEGGSTATSGVSIVDMNFSNTTHTWNVTAKNPVNFAPVLGTWGNCSGGTTPWNTVVTCEENVPAGDSNNDGYLDYGWCVELDPATRSVRDQNADGTPDKLWKLGRMYHENFMILSDRRTAYFGADMSTGFLFKFVATTPGQLGAGNLYVLQLSGALGTAATGIWLPIPNSTPTECNNVIPTAEALGATNFSNIEDVEVGPHDGRIYFTSKTNSRVYRFLDASNAALTVSGFEEFVGGQDYPITYDTGTAAESWREGNDNLTFDTEGNLYVLQDGGRNHIWLVKPCHTAANPQVQLFAVTPTGCEPTGMTLSPDNRFMFLSFQHPSSTNTQATTDAAGQSVVFNRSTTVVIARREVLGPQAVVTAAATARATSPVTLFPNPVSDQVSVQLDHDRAESASLQIISSIGRRVLERPISLKAGQNQVQLSVGTFAPGQYTLLIKTASGTISRSFIKL